MLACALLGLAFLPSARSLIQGAWQRSQQQARAACAKAAVWGGQRRARFACTLDVAFGGLSAWLRANGRWTALALLVLLAVPIVVLVLRSGVQVSPFDDTRARAVDRRVTALLQGEQLVPPAPLPPGLFLTPEVELAHPGARFANRAWALLDADFRQRLLLAFRLMSEQHGYTLVLLEGYRSPERQMQLAQLGPAVTRAGAYESYHQYGLAADVAFLRAGRIVVSERDDWAMKGYVAYGAVAASLGLTWGGNWQGLKDYGHVELQRPGVLRSGAAPQAAPPGG